MSVMVSGLFNVNVIRPSGVAHELTVEVPGGKRFADLKVRAPVRSALEDSIDADVVDDSVLTPADIENVTVVTITSD